MKTLPLIVFVGCSSSSTPEEHDLSKLGIAVTLQAPAGTMVKEHRGLWRGVDVILPDGTLLELVEIAQLIREDRTEYERIAARASNSRCIKTLFDEASPAGWVFGCTAKAPDGDCGELQTFRKDAAVSCGTNPTAMCLTEEQIMRARRVCESIRPTPTAAALAPR